MTARIFAEGGGPGELYDTRVRSAWRAFFEAAGLQGRMPRVVRGEGRLQAFHMFKTAVNHPVADEMPLLLIDSEGPVAAGTSVWQHLKARDNWNRPQTAGNDQAFLMVQVMETWFLADRNMLLEYFGPALRQNHFPQWPALEDVPKQTVFTALDNATAGCKKHYAKGKVSYELLENLSPALVEAACPHAKSLLDRLRNL